MRSNKSRILTILAIFASSLFLMGGDCNDDGDCIGIVCDDDKALVE